MINTYVLAFKAYFKKLSADKQEKILNKLMDVHLQQQKEENVSKKRVNGQSEEYYEYSGMYAMLD